MLREIGMTSNHRTKLLMETIVILDDIIAGPRFTGFPADLKAKIIERRERLERAYLDAQPQHKHDALLMAIREGK